MPQIQRDSMVRADIPHVDEDLRIVALLAREAETSIRLEKLRLQLANSVTVATKNAEIVDGYIDNGRVIEREDGEQLRRRLSIEQATLTTAQDEIRRRLATARSSVRIDLIAKHRLADHAAKSRSAVETAAIALSEALHAAEELADGFERKDITPVGPLYCGRSDAARGAVDALLATVRAHPERG